MITTLLIASALVFNVVDGDTLDIGGVRVRLVDIDTPELSGARCPAIAEGYALRWTPGMKSKAERSSIWCGRL